VLRLKCEWTCSRAAVGSRIAILLWSVVRYLGRQMRGSRPDGSSSELGSLANA
jgi:hypothetical protein